MSSSKNQKYIQIIKLFIGIALVAAVFAYFTAASGKLGIWGQKEEAIKVFPTIKDNLSNVQRIKITIEKGAFQIVQKDGKWTIPERGDYLVSSESIDKFGKALAGLEKLSLSTTDPSKFDSLSVGEPTEFGNGTVVQLFDKKDQIIEGEHIGKVGNSVYIRDMGAKEVYNTKGDMPDIGNLDFWLNFKLFDIKPNDIAKVSYQFTGQKEHKISRNALGKFEESGDTGEKVDNIALFLNKVKFVDVAEFEKIKTQPVFKHTTTLRNGASIELDGYDYHGLYWIQAKASGNNERTNRINAASEKYVYAISSDDTQLLGLK